VKAFWRLAGVVDEYILRDIFKINGRSGRQGNWSCNFLTRDYEAIKKVWMEDLSAKA